MRPNFGRWGMAPYWILIGFILIGFLGCSKEARMERHWKKGEKYFSQNKFNEAVIEYKNSLQLNPKNAQARYKLGLSYLRTNNFKGAFSEFSQAVDLDPNLIDARLQLGTLYLLSRDIPKARAQIEKISLKEPDNPSALLLNSSIYAL